MLSFSENHILLAKPNTRNVNEIQFTEKERLGIAGSYLIGNFILFGMPHGNKLGLEHSLLARRNVGALPENRAKPVTVYGSTESPFFAIKNGNIVGNRSRILS